MVKKAMSVQFLMTPEMRPAKAPLPAAIPMIVFLLSDTMLLGMKNLKNQVTSEAKSLVAWVTGVSFVNTWF